MLKPLKFLSFMALLLTANAVRTPAQTFTGSVGAEFILGDPSVVRPMNTSNFSSKFGSYDLYLSSWGLPLSGAPSEFIWQFTTPSDPTATVIQGSFLYNSVADLEVGMVYNSTTGKTNFLVAYYKMGTGHFLDIYDVTLPISAPVYNSTIQLSNSPNYGRIRMDSYSQYAVAIAWDYPGVGIQTMAGHNGSWSGVATLNGTSGESGPDIALFPINGTVYVHYAYYNASSGTITESKIDRNTILAIPAATTGSVTPANEDVNYIGSGLKSRIVLDCPDYYNVENWAYTYTDGTDVFVRYMDYYTLLLPKTVSVNSGILGNTSIAGQYQVYTPVLHYGSRAAGGPTGQIIVAWYATDNSSFNGYIGLEMTTDGTGLVSGPDYMALPNAFTPYQYPLYSVWYPNVAGISLSKNSDFNFAPDFLYATFYDMDYITGTYQLHHAFHKWGDVAFKGPGTTGIATGAANPTIELNTYPNPFRNSFTTAVVLQEPGMVQLQLHDLTGRLVWQQQASWSKGTHQVKAESLEQIAAGSYILTVSLNNKKLGTKMMTRE